MRKLRPPTAEEVLQRVESLRWIAAFVLYLLLGGGGGAVLAQFIHDNANRETFYMVWWLPSGVAAFWLSGLLTDWVSSYVPVEEK